MSEEKNPFAAEEPVAEEIRPGEVWDPVGGVKLEKKLEAEFRKLEREAVRSVWLDPVRVKADDQRDRVVVLGTGVRLVARKNHWGKWVALGVGVVDPVAAMEVPDLPVPLPWE